MERIDTVALGRGIGRHGPVSRSTRRRTIWRYDARAHGHNARVGACRAQSRGVLRGAMLVELRLPSLRPSSARERGARLSPQPRVSLMAVTALPRSSFWLAAARCSTASRNVSCRNRGAAPGCSAAPAHRQLHAGRAPLRGAAIPAGRIQGTWRAQRIRTCIWRRCRCVKHIDLANPKWVGEAWNKAADRFVVIYARC